MYLKDLSGKNLVVSMIVGVVEKAREIMEEETYERKRREIYLHKDLWKVLEMIIEKEGLVTQRGGRYPISWLVEDIILWVLSDEKRFQQFLDDTYEVIE